MNSSIYPCIWVNNNGKEMAAFYCNIFPDTIITENNGLVQMLTYKRTEVDVPEWRTSVQAQCLPYPF